jgi:FKBP-type peptidyl-prolyl cis-trans isomerase
VDYSAIDDSLIQKYLADNNITTAKKQASGLYFLPVQTNPNAAQITTGKTVAVFYTGHLLDAAGTVFDASSQHNDEALIFTAGAGQLIKGFDEGIGLMHIGDKAQLLIPSGLAYGNRQAGSIAPNSVLRFEVEAVEVATADDRKIVNYLNNNNITTAQKQPSGIYFQPLTTNPAGLAATSGRTASVLYTGYLMDASGKVFDASTQHNNVPYTFVVGNGSVPGFDAGIALMHKGERAQIFIPSEQAYGARGSGTAITPFQSLRFVVELVDVQ